MSESGKSIVEGMVEAQEKVFQAWKEAVEEYNNTRVLEIFGEDTRSAWQSCLQLQEKAFNLWKEAVLQFQPSPAQASSGELVLQNYRRWWDLQEQMLRSWKESASPVLFNPERMASFYREWLKMMQESFTPRQKTQPAKGKEN